MEMLLTIITLLAVPATYDVVEVWDVELPEPPVIRSVWDDLADCETGEWIDGGKDFVEGSARWEAQDGFFHGGLQFHPQTWASYRTSTDRIRAYEASRDEQIRVAERVLADQGWGAWPRCSELLGLR